MRVTTDRTLLLSMRCYRGLLRAYPQAFLVEFEDLLCQAFGDLAHRAVRTQGNWGLFVLWMRTLPDLLSSAFSQRFQPDSSWTFRLRWILACSIAIPTPFMLVFLEMFIGQKSRLLLSPPFDYAAFGFLLSVSLHGLTTGYLQSLTIGWKRPRRFLWVVATIAGMTSAMGLMMAFYLQSVLGRTGALILCASAVGIFQSLVLARKNVRAFAWIPASAIGLGIAWRIREAMPLVHLPIKVISGDIVFLVLLGGLFAGIVYGVVTILPLEWILQPQVAQDALSGTPKKLPS